MGRTLDISSTGVRVEVFQQTAPKTLMEMEIGVDESILPVQGKVVHAEKTGENVYVIGIQFDELQAELAK